MTGKEKQFASDDDLSDVERVVVECPMSWCRYTVVISGREELSEAALEIGRHVNGDHSQKDLETLGWTQEADSDASGGGD